MMLALHAQSQPRFISSFVMVSSLPFRPLRSFFSGVNQISFSVFMEGEMDFQQITLTRDSTVAPSLSVVFIWEPSLDKCSILPKAGHIKFTDQMVSPGNNTPVGRAQQQRSRVMCWWLSRPEGHGGLLLVSFNTFHCRFMV